MAMEDHIAEINTFCRICKFKLKPPSYKVISHAEVINFMYKKDKVDVTNDDPNCQSQFFCQNCYRSVKKCQEEIKFRKKNPNSSKKFSYEVPPYNENVTIYRGRAPEHDVEQRVAGVTPSKVRKLSGEPLESPSDKLSVREQRKRTPIRKSVKFDLEKIEANFETGDLNVPQHSIAKVYTSQDSVPMNRVENTDLAGFFSCRVCGKYPKEAKVSANCMHFYCKICIENYKTEVDSTKCPPAFSVQVDEGLENEKCLIPSTCDDIIGLAGLLKNIHESIKFECSKPNCGKSFNVKMIADHESECKSRGNYNKEGRSLFCTRSVILKEETSKTINVVLNWCQSYNVSPCDFLFFALKRLINTEAPELEESVQHVFQVFLKKEELEPSGMSALEGLALKIDTDLSNSQYQKLRMNKVFGAKLPSLVRVTQEKDKLDPGNVSYKVFSRSNGDLIEVHEAKANTGIIDVDDDLGNFSYGDLNINIGGCRATLHDTIAKFIDEKYLEIEEEIKEHPDSKDILSDKDRTMKVFAKVCFDGTSAPMKSLKGASRLPTSNWLRGTVGIVGVEIVYSKDIGESDTVADSEEVRDDEGGATGLNTADAVLGGDLHAGHREALQPEAVDFAINDIARMNPSTLSILLEMLPDNLTSMTIGDIVSKSKM